MNSRMMKFYVLLAIALLLAIPELKRFSTRASAPGFAEVDRTFTAVTLSQSAIDPISPSANSGSREVAAVAATSGFARTGYLQR
jgi:hypothetical protein